MLPNYNLISHIPLLFRRQIKPFRLRVEGKVHIRRHARRIFPTAEPAGLCRKVNRIDDLPQLLGKLIRAQPLAIQPVPDLRIVQMLPRALFELVPHRLILPDHLIRQIFQTGKTREIQLPLRQTIALAAVDVPGGGMQIPKLIMGHIGPGHKMIDGNVLRRQPILPVDFMNRRQLRKQLPIFFNLLQLLLPGPRLR